jgi:NADPH:quinone reductase-like Zn-dependent oxidoreductase
VLGFTDRRASHAEYVVVEAKNLTSKPAQVPWEVAGSLAIAGSTAYAAVLAELAALIAAGKLEIPIAATFPLNQVQEAFSQLEKGHIRGKLVLLP